MKLISILNTIKNNGFSNLNECMRYIIGIVSLCIMSFSLVCAETKDSTQNFYKVNLASVYDGDTFKVYLSCRYPMFCKKMGGAYKKDI